ncbi:MAG TPA: hypothetical protein VF070_35310 [Streptosporangiaceae bacterium]
MCGTATRAFASIRATTLAAIAAAVAAVSAHVAAWRCHVERHTGAGSGPTATWTSVCHARARHAGSAASLNCTPSG